MKSVIRVVLVTALAVSVLGFTGGVRAEEGKAPKQEKQEKPAKPKVPQLTGEITAVDVPAGTVTIDSKKAGVKTFSVTPTTKLSGEGKGTLADMKVGDKIVVHYTEADGKAVATKIGKANLRVKKDKPEEAKKAE